MKDKLWTFKDKNIGFKKPSKIQMWKIKRQNKKLIKKLEKEINFYEPLPITIEEIKNICGKLKKY